MANEEIKIVINADDKASGVFANVGKAASGVGSALSAVGKIAGVGLVAGLGAMTAEAYRAVGAFAEQEKADKQLEAVLKSTHNAAGLFIEDLQDQAAALQKVTTYGDEAIESAQGLLLTFTNVKGPVFQQAIGTILDMSTALGQDLKSSSIQVGKALNDPIQGITALSRVGVSFTEQQKDMIEKMVKAGDTMGAQKLILAELTTEFGGSATAAAQAFSGKLEVMKNAFGELEESLGSAIVTALTPFITQLTTWAQSEEAQAKIKQITDGIVKFGQQMAPIIAQVLPVFITLLEAAGKTILAVAKFLFKDLPDAIGTAIFNITQIIQKIQDFINKIEEAMRKLRDLVSAPSGGTLNPFKENFALPSWVPKFAAGGIVTGPTLAMVGEAGPEAIVPLSKAGGMGGITINISGNSFLDQDAPRKMAAAMIDELKLELRI